jgi:hypothetical protein
MCTHEECGMAMFEQKSSWIDHETEQHWRYWFCHLCNFNSHTQSDVAWHLERFHRNDLNQHTEDLSVYMGSRPLEYLDASRCALCDWDKLLLSNGSVTTVSRDSFMGHLAHHLEQLALFAIPRATSDRTSGSLEANHAAHQSSRASQSVDVSSFLGGIQSIDSGTIADLDGFVGDTRDSQAASLTTISQAFPSTLRGDDILSVWIDHAESHSQENSQTVTAQEVLNGPAANFSSINRIVPSRPRDDDATSAWSHHIGPLNREYRHGTIAQDLAKEQKKGTSWEYYADHPQRPVSPERWPEYN